MKNDEWQFVGVNIRNLNDPNKPNTCKVYGPGVVTSYEEDEEEEDGWHKIYVNSSPDDNYEEEDEEEEDELASILKKLSAEWVTYDGD